MGGWLKEALGKGWSAILGLTKDRKAAEAAEQQARLQEQMYNDNLAKIRQQNIITQNQTALANQTPVNDVANIEVGATADLASSDTSDMLLRKKRPAASNITLGL